MSRVSRGAACSVHFLVAVSLIAAVTSQCARATPSPVAVAGASPARGQEALRQYGCWTCHTIPGVPGARGRVGPSLDGVANRMYLAGNLANTPEQMMRWIDDPPAVQPRTAMPRTGVTSEDLRHITAYLYQLR
jgi:cytochrome c